ncbi:MAG: alpha/beta hydrolase [Rhodospirillaceae bacterium]|nr:alpha/beta hydrolase [Rhodospirillaceae bacterium]|tara:strand:+ start:259 stop:1008 length:750 start_codon:yes stop_codon:yes gene_type:complete
MTNIPKFLNCRNGSTIAYHKIVGKEPNIVFLGGYMSDMDGTKAISFQNHCQSHGLSYLRFDYSGHGRSSGEFIKGTIKQWSDDTICVIDQLTQGPLILVGSSMGGWIMMLAALARPERIRGLIGIAAAPDFTEQLMWNRFPAKIKQTLLREKIYYQPTEYSDKPYPITLNLIEDARQNLILDKPIPIKCPVHLFQGQKDNTVPWQHAMQISKSIPTNNVTITFIKNGDHRLSREKDLRRIFDAIIKMSN